MDLRNSDAAIFVKEGRINLSWLKELYNAFPDKNNFVRDSFEKLAGTKKLRKQIIAGVSDQEFRKSWEPDLSNFKVLRKKYLIYKDGN